MYPGLYRIDLSLIRKWRRDLGLDVFRHGVLGDDQVSVRVTASIVRLVERERFVLLL